MKNRCPDEEYNNDTGERMTDIKKAETSDGQELLQYLRSLNAPQQKSTPALEFGTSVHAGVLLGEEDFIVQQHDGRTKAGKEEKALAAIHGYRIVKQDEADRIRAFVSKGVEMLTDRFGSSPADDDTWLAECALYGEYEGMPLKVKLDAYRDGCIVDLKSISRWPDEGAFLRHIEKYGYPLSACGYINVARQEGLEVNDYYWLFVESVWPHRARFVRCPEWMLDNTWSRLETCYRNMKQLDDFIAPTEVELQPEDWWLYRYSEDQALEGVESYEE